MKFAPEMFHLTKWKPITPVQYVDEIATIMLSEIQLEKDIVTTFDDDTTDAGSHTIVTMAKVKTFDKDGSDVEVYEPYLMLVSHTETGKNMCFVRRDAYPSML